MKEQDKKRINDIRDICRGIEYIEQDYLSKAKIELREYEESGSGCIEDILEAIIPKLGTPACVQDFESSEWKIIEDAIIDLARLIIKDYERMKQELEARL